jgi:Flp pilus assembly protein TadB
MPLEIQRVAPLAAAIALGVVGYVTSLALSNRVRVRGARERVANFVGMQESAFGEEVNVGSQVHKVRLALAGYGVDVTGREQLAMWGIRILMSLILSLAIWWIGFPLMAVPAGAVVGWLLANSLVEGAWARMRRGIEEEIPTFLSRLAGTVQADPNVLQAMDEVGETLDSRGPLRGWVRRLVARVRAGGRPAHQEMLVEAETVSPSLGLVVFEVGRLWETGGSGYVEAFSHAAQNLGEILDSRARAEAKGAGMKSAIRIVLGSLVLVIAIMLRNPSVSASIRTPVVQLAYLAIAVWVALGWNMINGLIEEAIR